MMMPRLFEVWFAAGAIAGEEDGGDIGVDAVLALDGPFASVDIVDVGGPATAESVDLVDVGVMAVAVEGGVESVVPMSAVEDDAASLLRDVDDAIAGVEAEDVERSPSAWFMMAEKGNGCNVVASVMQQSCPPPAC